MQNEKKRPTNRQNWQSAITFDTLITRENAVANGVGGGFEAPQGPKRTRHRLNKDELALLEETHRQHKRKKWSAQVAVYNAATKQRGWYAKVKVGVAGASSERSSSR